MGHRNLWKLFLVIQKKKFFFSLENGDNNDDLKLTDYSKQHDAADDGGDDSGW